jgi:hypothetical protein
MGTIQDKLDRTAVCKQKIMKAIQSRCSMPNNAPFKLYPMYMSQLSGAIKLPYTDNDSRLLSDPYSTTNRDLEYIGLTLSSCADSNSSFTAAESHGGNITLMVDLPNITLNCAVFTYEKNQTRRNARLTLTDKLTFLTQVRDKAYTNIGVNSWSWSAENFVDTLPSGITYTDASQFVNQSSWAQGSPRGAIGSQDAFEYRMINNTAFQLTDGAMIMRLNVKLTLS